MNLQVINPYDQQIYYEFPFADQSAVQRTLEKAQKAFQKWKQIPLPQRVTQLREGMTYFEKEKDQIARDITCQMGKPLQESYREIDTMLERSAYLLSHAEEFLAPEIIPQEGALHRRIERIPLGVVFDIAAWNYPLLIAINVVLPALLSGNAVILKHSEKTPLCGKHFENAYQFLEVNNIFSHVILTNPQTLAMIKNVDHVVFTGSARVGKIIYQEVAKYGIDVGLELGGKDPAYVREDTDLDYAVANIVDGACYNAGQSCCAIERVYVHESKYDDFVEQAREIMAGYVLGNPLEETTNMGPLARVEAIQFVTDQIAEAKSRGAQILLGGSKKVASRNHFLPTLLTEVPHDARVMQEESFAPLLPVVKVKDDKEALALINDSQYGLTASIWTKDRERAEWLATQIEAGTIFQNRSDFCDPSLPWIGYQESGKGSSLSRYGFYHLTKPKSIHFRSIS